MKSVNERWLISKDGLNLDGSAETRFTVSNGCFAVRGTTDELYYDETPGTYIAGVYGRDKPSIAELVNLPYPFGTRIYINREYMDFRSCEIKHHRQELDMRNGIYKREFTVTDREGRRLRICSVRFASMAERHLGAGQTTVTCENFSGVINIESFIECSVYNYKHNPNIRKRYFTARTASGNKDAVAVCTTPKRTYTVGIGIDTKTGSLKQAVRMSHYYRSFSDFTAVYDEFEVNEGAVIEIERIVAFCTSRETEASLVGKAVGQRLSAGLIQGYNTLYTAHSKEMNRIWDLTDISIEGDPEADKALRFCLYTLICSANPDDEHVSIGAKGLHGEGYRGHVFWDTEVFMLPFFIYTLPDYAKTLLSYRWHKLPKACENAASGGFAGARYPWESADIGLEETPKWGQDYKGNKVRIWTGDIEYHITSDIVYALREYVRATGDEGFLKERAAPIVFETARFWISRLEYNEDDDVYKISNVVGPDEFHDNVDNNAYTNALTQWNLRYASELASRYGTDYGVSLKEAEHWKTTADKVYVPHTGGIIEQFDGYFKLKDCPITEFDSNHMPVWPKGVDITKLNKYQLIKQADVIMLMHLLYEQFSTEALRENYAFYEKRTMHKSSLGPSIYALMGIKTGHYEKAYANFMRTVLTDITDNQGNTKDGVHAASTGGAWCAMFYGFCGVRIDSNGNLTIDPWLPDKWKSVKMNFEYQKRRLCLTVTVRGAELKRLSGPSGLKVIVEGKEITV